MEKVKQIPKKFLAMILSFVLLISAIPFGVFSVFAAGDDCIATKINSTKVYFYGIDALETKDLTVKYEGGEGSISVFVGGTEAADDTGVSVSGKSVTFDEDWLDEQIDWIAIKCNSTASIPSSEPSVDVDNTAPVISGVDGNPTEWAKSATLTVKSTDTDIYSYSIDKTNWQSENSFNVTENEDYSLYAKDKSGNVSDAFEITVDKIDTIAPTINSISIDPETWTNQTVTMLVYAEDTGAGLHEAAYKMDDGEWQNSNAFAISDSNEHTFYVRDALENTQTTTKTAERFDNVKPTVSKISVSSSIRNIDDGGYVLPDYEYTVKIIAEDNESGISPTEGYSIDGTNWQASNQFKIKGKNLARTYYVKDTAGNINTKTFGTVLDNEPPVINSATPNTTAKTKGEVKFTIVAQDNEGGIGLHPTAAYKLDNGNWQYSNVVTVKDSDEHTVYVRDGLAEESTDTNHVASITIQATNINKKAAVINDVELSTLDWTNKTVQATVIATPTTKHGVTFEITGYRMDGGAWQESNVFEINDSVTHKFEVIDESTNISDITDKSTRAVTNYDANAPVLAYGQAVKFTQTNSGKIASILNKLTFGRYFNETLVVTANAKDVKTATSNVSGIVSATFTFKDSNSKTYSYNAAEIGNTEEVTIEFEIPKSTLPANFKGTAEITLLDAAGNESVISLNTDNSDMGTMNDASDYTFMIENDKPVIIDEATDITTCGGLISKSNYTLEFKVNDIIKDADKSSGIAYVSVKVNDQEVASGDGQVIDYQKDHYTNVETYSIYADADNYTVNGVRLDDWNDGVLKYEISACDNAGNVSDITELTYRFDQTAPIISNIEISKKEASKVAVFDYGFFFNEDTAITITASDALGEKEATASGVKGIKVYLVGEYYQDAAKADPEQQGNIIYTYDANGSLVKINSITEAYCFLSNSTDTEFSTEITVPANFKGQIYALAVDNAENSAERVEGVMQCRYFSDSNYDVNQDGYVHPDGTVVETPEMHRENSDITIKMPDTAKTQNEKFDSRKVNIPVNENGNRTLEDKKMDYEEHLSKPVALYNKADNRDFTITVSENFSGIQKVQYYVFQGDYTFGSETAFEEVEVDVHGELSDGSWNPVYERDTGKAVAKDTNLVVQLSKTITVDGNYNDMVLLVVLTDRAGNMSYDYVAFGIDKTAPTISVRYNNNDGDSQSGTGTYFDNHRKATVVIAERNFNKENVKWTIKNDEGDAPSVKYLGSTNGSGNKDNATHTFEINYNYDGVFSFDVSYTDRATNKNAAVDYGNSLAPKAFVVDTVNPTITVSYNNNSAQNEKYFKEYRTATITIVEHNFDVNRVKFTMTAALSGSAKAIPAISWNHSGDTHVATINYNSDGDYTFDITMEDKSGRKEKAVNYGNSVAAKDFVIDTTYLDIVKVDGVANGDIFGLRDDGSINDAAEIKITFNDVNFDKYSIHLYRNRVLVDGISKNAKSGDKYEEKDVITTANKNAVENDADVTEEFIGSVANGSSNTTVTFDIPAVDENKVKNDGMYTLRIEANDKAGNAYDTNSNVITFAVNRYGSVYTVDDELYNLINDNEGYTQAIAGDIVIREYNTTDVTTNKLSILRGTTPLEGVECKPSAVSQTGVEWHEYAYKVDKSYFMDGDKYVDGEYSLIISSTDKADIKSTNDKYDACQLGFVLDTTAPKINGITPSAESKNISLDNYLEIASDEDVTFTVPVTDNLRLSTVEIFIGDTSDDATPAYVYTYKGDKVEVNTDKGGTFNEQTRFDDCSFTLSPGTSRQNFRVKVTDKVGLTVDTADFESGKVAPGFEGFFNEVLITSNWFVRMWNRPVFKIALGSGLLAAIAASAFIIIAKKRKKDDDEEQPQTAE